MYSFVIHDTLYKEQLTHTYGWFMSNIKRYFFFLAVIEKRFSYVDLIVANVIVCREQNLNFFLPFIYEKRNITKANRII